MKSIRTGLKLMLLVIFVDLVIIVLLMFPSFVFLSNIIFFEGGIMLTIGGLMEASSSLYVGKFRKIILNSADWKSEQHRKSQQKARTFISSGVFLLILTFIIYFLNECV